MYITQSNSQFKGELVAPIVNVQDFILQTEAIKPLPVASLTQAAIPSLVDVSIIATQPNLLGAKGEKSMKLWAVEQIDTGRAQIDISRDYRLTIDENNRALTVDNYKTGLQTVIWGAPPPALNTNVVQPESLEFWGTTTFVLENHTRITVQTKADDQNASLYILDKVIVTKGDRALVITDAGNDVQGDMSVCSNDDGWSLDLETADNMVLKEISAGAGWSRPGKNGLVTQADLDKTAVGERFGPDKQRLSLNDLRKLITQFLTISMSNMLTSSFQNSASAAQNLNENTKHDDAREVAVKSAQRAAEERAKLEKNFDS